MLAKHDSGAVHVDGKLCRGGSVDVLVGFLVAVDLDDIVADLTGSTKVRIVISAFVGEEDGITKYVSVLSLSEVASRCGSLVGAGIGVEEHNACHMFSTESMMFLCPNKAGPEIVVSRTALPR